MKVINIEEGYDYLPEHNILVNSETLNKLKSYFKNANVKLSDTPTGIEAPSLAVNKINQVIFQMTKDWYHEYHE